jgi:diguanylate cyclase (GGDEF)-like protein
LRDLGRALRGTEPEVASRAIEVLEVALASFEGKLADALGSTRCSACGEDRPAVGTRAAALCAACLEPLFRRVAFDPFTQTLTRRAMGDEVNLRVARVARGRPLAAALLDVDWYLAFNDHHGHDVGDTMLQGLAQILRQAAPDKIIARTAGGEFLVILEERQDARAHAEALRKAVETHDFGVAGRRLRREGVGYDDAPVTISAGVASCGVGMRTSQFVQLLYERLHAAKSSGRNCVIGGDESAEVSLTVTR